MSANPWVSEAEAVEPVAVVRRVEAEPAAWRAGPDVPDVPDVVDGLGRVVVDVDGDGRRWLAGAHGGAGVTSLARLLDWGDAGASWPVDADGGDLRVWVVARTHAAGIGAAQRAAVQWAGGGAPGVELAGVVWVADSPKRLPRSLRGRRALVSGAFPTSVAVPWVGAWREGDAWASPAPIRVRRALRALTAQEEEDR